MIARCVGAALALACLYESARAFDAWAGGMSRDQPDYVRVMTHNALNQYPNGTAAQTAAHERLLSAIQPDIISYQEMDPGSALALRTRLQAVLGGTWTHGQLGAGNRVLQCQRPRHARGGELGRRGATGQ